MRLYVCMTIVKLSFGSARVNEMLELCRSSRRMLLSSLLGSKKVRATPARSSNSNGPMIKCARTRPSDLQLRRWILMMRGTVLNKQNFFVNSAQFNGFPKATNTVFKIPCNRGKYIFLSTHGFTVQNFFFSQKG